LAIKKNYPSHLLPKVLIRKMKSLKKLGKEEDLQTTIEELESVMKHLQMTEKGFHFFI
jgi:hypothetical protein